MANIEVDIKLGTSGVKALIRELKAFSESLTDKTLVAAEREVAERVAEKVRANIAAIPNLDGNYDGGDPASVSVQVGRASGHEVVWRGTQVAFLEFGTGAAGNSPAYAGTAMRAVGYHPDPTKKSWYYYDDAIDGDAVQSFGIPPYAPMYNAAVEARLDGSTKVVVGPVIGRALREIRV